MYVVIFVMLHQALKAQAKLQQGNFDFEDFLNSMRQLKRMGPLRQVMEMLPGFNKLAASPEMKEALESDQLKYIEAIILSMTREERRNPDIINSRRRLIAKGSGTKPEEVNQLLKQFGEMRTMMRQMSSGKGPWAQMTHQYGGGEGIPGLSAVSRSSGGKKTGKAARKEKRKHKAKSGRR